MYCKACLEKDLKIEELKETVRSLQAKLRYRERKEEDNTMRKGGGVFGHNARTRKKAPIASFIWMWGMSAPTVIESTPTQPESILYRVSVKECTRCRRVFRARPPSVLPKSLYGNQIAAQTAVMHYFHGITMGRITEMTGISLKNGDRPLPPYRQVL